MWRRDDPIQAWKHRKDCPFFDPENVDPDHKHLNGMVWAIDNGQYDVGTVCSVYELCGHPLCHASYALLVAYENAKQALAQKETTQ
jgi:hypothetical protein